MGYAFTPAQDLRQESQAEVVNLPQAQYFGHLPTAEVRARAVAGDAPARPRPRKSITLQVLAFYRSKRIPSWSRASLPGLEICRACLEFLVASCGCFAPCWRDLVLR